MKILLVTSEVPHANVVGGHTIVRERVTRLAEMGHQVGLAAFAGNGKHRQADELKSLLYELELVDAPRRRSWFKCLLDYFFSGIPVKFQPMHSKAMAQCIGNMVHRSHYDVLIAEFSAMGQYIHWNPYLPAVRKIVSCHRSETIMYRIAHNVQGNMVTRIRDRIVMKGLTKYEFDMYRSADRVLVMTPQERWSLLNYAPNLQISVVPSGVDALRFRPPRYESTEQCIMFTGYYCDKPNEDAALWFGNKVWPQLRERHAELKFYMVGPEPTDAMREMARRDKRMIITGRVKDIRDYLARAQIFVCPVRLGTGMRGKIIEAMAGGVPLVSTTLGVEGIPAQTGYNCFLADRPDIMLRHIDLLLGDPPLRRSIAKRAREMVVERFSWRHVIALLDQVLQETVPGTGR